MEFGLVRCDRFGGYLKSLTFWITPFTNLSSLNAALLTVHQLTPKGWAPSLLLPTHFGQWPQSQCTQSLPADLLVSGPADIDPIRSVVEAAGVGFGAWGVPVDLTSPELAAGFAAASGYYVANFEPGPFWTPGDDPAAVDAWWQRYWDSLPDPDALSGNTAATVIPNQWGLSAFQNSLPNLAAGCGALTLEVYGGLNTAGQYPTLWPADGFASMHALGVSANLYPILALANLKSSLTQAARLGHSNVHVWSI